MQETKELTEGKDFEVLEGVKISTIREGLKQIQVFKEIVHKELIPNVDYGTIEGTKKPTLLKPGAEKIAKLLCCADTYEIIGQIEDWDKPLFSYTVKCKLVSLITGKTISEGLGECNSMEEKYRWRWVFDNQIPPHIDREQIIKKTFKSKKGNMVTTYRVPNEEIFTQKNTFLKMAKKRACVDAALSAGRLSDLFTQDMEDINKKHEDIEDDVKQEAPVETKQHETKPPEQKTQTNGIMATEEQVKMINTLIFKNPDPSKICNIILEEYKIDVYTELTFEQANKEIKKLGGTPIQGSKPVDTKPADKPADKPKEETKTKSGGSTVPQQKAIHVICDKLDAKNKSPKGTRLNQIYADFNIKSTTELSKEDAGGIISAMNKE